MEERVEEQQRMMNRYRGNKSWDTERHCKGQKSAALLRGAWQIDGATFLGMYIRKQAGLSLGNDDEPEAGE